MPKTALLIIDVQNDFVSGGTLCVPNGDAVIPVCNALRKGFHWDAVVLTQDWHPPNHLSFHDNYTPTLEHFSKRSVTLDSGPMSGTTFTQIMWPRHCVMDTLGAEFCPSLAREDRDVVVRKGTNATVDSYSGFGDEFSGRVECTALNGCLKERGITAVVVVGLALDMCVAFTAQDAVRQGYDTYLVRAGCRGITEAGVVEKCRALEGLGVHIVDTPEDLPLGVVQRVVEGKRKGGE